MVASQLRIPRVLPLPKKVLTHSTFKALLEKRRHTLDALIVLLKSEATRGVAGNITDRGDSAEEWRRVDGKVGREPGPVSESAEDSREENGRDNEPERVIEDGNEGEMHGRTVEETRGRQERKNEDMRGAGEGNIMEEGNRGRENDSDMARLENGHESLEDVSGAGLPVREGPEALGDSRTSLDGLPQPAPPETETRPDEPGGEHASAMDTEDSKSQGAVAEAEGRKAAVKADLEDQLNKLESKKHMLVQQLKQVLVREDSRKMVRPSFGPSPIPSPSSFSSFYLPSSSPLPSAASSHPSPLGTPTPMGQSSVPPKKDDDALEEGELPEGGSPGFGAGTGTKPYLDSERGSVLGGDWDRGPDRTRLAHTASWDRERYYSYAGEWPGVSPKSNHGGRMGPQYHQPVTLRRNFSLGPNHMGPNRFPLRSFGSGLGSDGLVSPQESMLADGPSPGGGITNFQYRPRGK